jgi:hypothetical protein
MEKVDAWLSAEIHKLMDAAFKGPYDAGLEAFKEAIKDKVLESYRNGQRSRRSKKETEPTSQSK